MKLLKPKNLDAKKVTALVGDTDAWHINGDWIHLPDDCGVTQADLDACVIPPVEVEEQEERADLLRMESRLLRRAVGIIAKAVAPKLDPDDKAALDGIRTKLQRLEDLLENLS